MNTIPLLEPVFRFFASLPMGLSQLADLTAEEAKSMDGAYERQLELIPLSRIEMALADESFQFFNEHVSDPAERKRKAAEWVLAAHLEAEIPRQRLSLLADTHSVRPRPYDHPALADVDVSPDGLVSVREFDFEHGVFARNGYVFSMLPSVESPNAAYWFLKSAAATSVFQDFWIRLDPFLWGRDDEFLPMFYKMLVYGVPLDWERIRALRQEHHGRWQPGKLSRSAIFTDYVWSPRGSEVHFQCEEVPHQTDVTTRGSRYLHAIYSVPNDAIIHLDGAVRILSESEWSIRHSRHVRSAGKIGYRAKVFRIDVPVSRDILSDLTPQFFVWNNDVARYFGQSLPDDF